MYCTLNNMHNNNNMNLYYNRPPPPTKRENFNNPAPSGLNWRDIHPQREPSQFGPHYWYMLHSMALNYPVNPTMFAKQKMKAFIEAIPFLLPCKNCTEHAKEFMAQADINKALQGKKELFTFFWNFHNLVNKRLGKQEMSFENALNMYKG